MTVVTRETASLLCATGFPSPTKKHINAAIQGMAATIPD